eukprot:TRINITY_DN8169_c0_g1_i1.p1 TRINITY_DN8169_c0_g1~~TRINITY_DN8169_c0_g1_i1.p1  ORF type:complete len:373 (+),score=70.88 TRINITY_DN8169_c0_g1_i1:142-1260(+)
MKAEAASVATAVSSSARPVNLHDHMNDLQATTTVPKLWSAVWNSTMRSQRAQEVVAGSFAGIVGTALGHPLDTIKVRVQTQTKASPIYKSSVDCFFKIVKHEGVTGLYKGLASPMLNLTILNSLAFGIYGEAKRLILKINSSTSSSSEPIKLKPIHYYLAGSLVGATTSFISTPFEMVKVRLQLDNITERRYSGSIACAIDMTKRYGSRMLFTGFWVNTAREVTFCSVYFGVYELLKHKFSQLSFLRSSSVVTSNPILPHRHAHHTPKETSASPLAILFAGGFAGMAAWFASFPLDVIKSNIQGQSLDAIANKSPDRKRFWNVSMERWQNVGLRGFYSGIVVSIVRAFFVSSSRFAAYELAVHFMTSAATSE